MPCASSCCYCWYCSLACQSLWHDTTPEGTQYSTSAGVALEGINDPPLPGTERLLEALTGLGKHALWGPTMPAELRSVLNTRTAPLMQLGSRFC